MALSKKENSGFSTLEFVIIFAMLFIIIVCGALRMDIIKNRNSFAHAKKNLQTIHKLENRFYKQHNRFGELSEVNFKFPNPSHPFEYLIIYDANSFQAVAQEKKGFDPRGNGRTGDEIMTIDQNGYLGY